MAGVQLPRSRPAQVILAPAPTKDIPRSTAGSNSPSETLMPYTCLTCVKRKVKCDKLLPKCSTCQKAKLGCEYQAPPPRKRKRRDVDDVNDRLAKYERILKTNGLLDEAHETPASEHSRSSPQHNKAQSPAVPAAVMPGVEDEATLHARLAKLHKDGRLLSKGGKSRYVNSSLWRDLHDDVLDSSDEEDEIDEKPPPGLTPVHADLNLLAANMVSPVSTHMSLLDYHPTYDTAMFLWKSYVEYVEPLIKVVHVPTTIKIVQQAASNPATASKPVECLLFAIYHFAVCSLTDEECARHMPGSRAAALTRFSNAANQAFINASFLKTTNMMVLQAYMLYLLSIRTTCDPQTYWILTGIAVRLSQRLGIHRDGDELGLSPFETQMRRRYFWQMLPLDGLASQSCGTGISLQADSWTTKQPLNLNDEDIWPEMTEQPEPKAGATDMIFCLCRAEVGKFFQRAYPFLGNWSKVWEARDGVSADDMLKFVDEIENVLENKYIRYCDIFQPIHGITNAMARVGMNIARFRILVSQIKGKQQQNEEEVKKPLALAIKVIEYGIGTAENPLLARFHWHLKAFFQWDPLAFILNEVLRKSPHIDPDIIWPKIERVYKVNPDLILQKRTLNLAIGRLVIKAWDTNPALSIVPREGEPKFISKLRETCVKKDDLSLSRSATESKTQTSGEMNGLASGMAPSTDYQRLDMAAAMNSPDISFMNGFDNDNMDWEFWDRLIRDPYAFTQE